MSLSITPFTTVHLHNVESIKQLAEKASAFKDLFEIEPSIWVRGIFVDSNDCPVFLKTAAAKVTHLHRKWMTVDLVEEGIAVVKPDSEPFDADLCM